MLKRLMILCAAVFLLVGVSAAAQYDALPYEPAYIGDILREFEWLADSRTVNFGVGEEIYETYTYSTLDKSVRPLESWTPSNQYTILREAGLDTAILNDPQTGKRSLIYPSPNNQFMVYGVDIQHSSSQAGGYRRYGVGIINLITGERIVLNDVSISSTYSPIGFQVIWSGNSSAFVVNTDFGFDQKSYYINNFSKDLNHIQSLLFQDRYGVIVAATYNLSPWIYDIDNSGDHVLVDAFNPDDNDPWRRLVVLNMPDLTYKVVATYSFRSPLFQRPDYNSINFISVHGIFNYDLQSGVTTLRNANINSDWVSLAAFSPDGRYIALERQNYFNYLYVLEIDSETSIETTPSTPIP